MKEVKRGIRRRRHRDTYRRPGTQGSLSIPAKDIKEEGEEEGGRRKEQKNE